MNHTCAFTTLEQTNFDSFRQNHSNKDFYSFTVNSSLFKYSFTKQRFYKHTTQNVVSYIWSNKLDKIKSLNIMQDYQDAELRMVNLDNFIYALKLSWIYRLFRGRQNAFIPVFEQCISPIDNLPKILIKRTGNVFGMKFFALIQNYVRKLKLRVMMIF